jgi:hypothetical protein
LRGRSLMSTTSPGRSTFWPTRSTSVVPPARNALSRCSRTVAMRPEPGRRTGTAYRPLVLQQGGGPGYRARVLTGATGALRRDGSDQDQPPRR